MPGPQREARGGWRAMHKSALDPHLDPGLEAPQPDFASASLRGRQEPSTGTEAHAPDGLGLARGQLVHVFAAVGVEDL